MSRYNRFLNNTLKAIRNYDLIAFENNYKKVNKINLEDLRATVSVKKMENKDLIVRNFRNNMITFSTPLLGSFQYIVYVNLISDKILYPLTNFGFEIFSGTTFFISLIYPFIYYFESEDKDKIEKNKQYLKIFQNKLK